MKHDEPSTTLAQVLRAIDHMSVDDLVAVVTRISGLAWSMSMRDGDDAYDATEHLDHAADILERVYARSDEDRVADAAEAAAELRADDASAAA